MATQKQKLVMAKYVEQLDLLDGWDCEADHMYADNYILDALRELGFGEVADAYERVQKRCAWWAYA